LRPPFLRLKMARSPSPLRSSKIKPNITRFTLWIG
jgi:hypothetical protein